MIPPAANRTEKRIAEDDDPKTYGAAPNLATTIHDRERATISIRTSTMVYGVVIVVLVAAVSAFGGLWLSAKSDLSDRDARAAADQRAEQVATDYAVGASNINFQDVGAWLGKLKANTSPQLGNKFDATAPQLQEILVPLQWTSTAVPIDAVVESETDGIYKVNVFLNVTSTSAQTPAGAQTTVTYNITIDTNSDWLITDVGGMDGALPAK
jgi:Mce-associated membrane protein